MEKKTGESYTSCTIPVTPPLVAGATTFPPRWEACHWILSRLRLPANPVPLPPQFGGAAKGKRLNGQARRLTSPHLEVLCRTSTGDYKAPLCLERFMKGLLCGSLLSHRSAGGRWYRKAPKGEKSHRRWLIDVMLFCHMTLKVNPVTLTLYSSPDRAIPQPSARRAVKLKNPWARKGPSILRTFFRNPSTQPAAIRRPQPSGRSPVNPHTEGVSNHMGNSLFVFSLTYSQKWSTMYSLSSTAERESLPSVFQERLR